MQNPEIVIIGAAIIDVLAYPVNVKVFETGSYSTEDIHMTTGDRKSTRLNSSHIEESRMPSSA